MTTELNALNSFAYDPAFAALFADWRARLLTKNQGSDADFWLELVPFAMQWQAKTLDLFRLQRPSGKTYAGALKSFLENALPGVDKTDFTAVLWLGKNDHVAIAKEHIRSLNWAGDVRKLNSPRAIRNAVQRMINAQIEEAEATEAATARAEDNGVSVAEQEELDQETSFQAMLDADEVSAEGDPSKGVIGAYLKKVRHNTLYKRVIAVRGDDYMRETSMRVLVELLTIENERRAAAAKKPLTMGQWFKCHKFEI